MGIYNCILKRNKNTQSDQEFMVVKQDDFNDGVMRMYSQSPYYMKESEIISDIESDYRTRNSDNTTTEVGVGTRNGKKYIYSIPNNTIIDNISKLEKY